MKIDVLKPLPFLSILLLLNCGVDGSIDADQGVLQIKNDTGQSERDEGRKTNDLGQSSDTGKMPDLKVEDLAMPNDGKWDACKPESYKETLVHLDVSVSDIIAAHQEAQYRELIKVGLQRRAPFTRWIIDEVQKTQNFDCIEVYASDVASLGAFELLQRATTVVHECAHGLNMATWDGVTHDYYVRPDEVYRVNIIEGPQRRVIKNYLPWEDTYSETYLDLSGDQQFDMVLEEVNGYINDLISGVAFVDVAYEGQQYSLRDGTTTLLLYMAIYLHHIRMNDNSVYQSVLKDKDWRVLILTLWDRGLLSLELAAPYPELGIEDAKIRVELDKFSDEIDRIRAEHCP